MNLFERIKKNHNSDFCYEVIYELNFLNKRICIHRSLSYG